MKKRLALSDLHNYQNESVDHIVAQPESMLWLGVGLGKSITTLTAFNFLRKIGQSSAMLIVAPLRVCQLTWRQEAEKWAHTNHLTFSLMCGSEKKRQRALFRKADIYLVNYESLTWLATQLAHYFIDAGHPMPFDMLVFDEVSKVKREDSKRFAAFAPIAPKFSRRVGLTASPCSNGMQDVWGQFFMLDGGRRLHQKFKAFQSAFFYQGNGAYAKWIPYDDTKEMIVNRISDMTIELSAADAGLDIPALTVIDTWIEFSPRLMKQYKELETQFFIELDEGGRIEVFNRAALCNKLLQFGNGRVYSYPDELNPDVCIVEKVHDQKYDALAEIVEGSGDDPILLAYSFTSERERIMEIYPDAECLTGVSEEEAIGIMDRFNRGETKLLIAHPLCLEGETEVLTESRGWVEITEIRRCERVFDGVEFVNHSGCSYSGYADVIDRLGLGMTPAHRMKINGKWIRGNDVRDNRSTRQEALYTYKGDDAYLGEMCAVREGKHADTAKRNEAQPQKAHVYDIVDCGERNQFAVRNKQGEIFISHNSAGHGLNLQYACNIVVWFGLNYNLELYEQFIGRIHRQGQRDAVQCFRVVARGTMDEAVMSALLSKDATQSAMKAAINEYRGVECSGEIDMVFEEQLAPPPPPPPPPPPQ